ncbi:PEPxxWA-CTERM sorting domain-containing protein [Glacieibacterium sp.]|uniref:PEPxxWA-CTERM sorting domain-containing protein n=1 Tax=Glacieibacterium sp. TaxID=2860237 RepID=UPI003B00D9DB
MFIKSLAVAAALLTAGVASALPTTIDFNDGTAPGFTGDYQVFAQGVSGVAAAVNGTSFLAVPNSNITTSVATYTSPFAFTNFAFDWGTPDSYNTVTFTGANGFTKSVTGSGVATGRATFVFSAAQGVNTVSFSSSNRAFEIDNISAAVPEPATWAMLLGGFAMVGVSARRRSRALAA